MKSLIGQHLFIGVSGYSLTNDEKKFIVENGIGGVVLFARNAQSPEQVRELCAEIQSLRHQTLTKAPLFIGIDMEGGRVARLKAPFTQWPPLRKIGELDSPTVAFQFAYNMGLELKAVGINLDFAPCVDVFTNPNNTVIGDRSLSSDPEIVGKLSSALVRGYIKSGIIPCAKHFPGHGNTLVDSHDELPVESADRKRLDDVELIPFKKAFRARLDMVMTSHIKFEKIDPQWPVTLSEIFLKKVLREESRYRGLVVTDDLGMKAMTKHHDSKEIAVRALSAGADLLLYCNEPAVPPIAIAAIEEALSKGILKKADLEASFKRIIEVKKNRILQADPPTSHEMMKIVGHSDHFKLAQAIAAGEVPQGLIGAHKDDE